MQCENCLAWEKGGLDYPGLARNPIHLEEEDCVAKRWNVIGALRSYKPKVTSLELKSFYGKKICG
jgi:hypothetical protein